MTSPIFKPYQREPQAPAGCPRSPFAITFARAVEDRLPTPDPHYPPPPETPRRVSVLAVNLGRAIVFESPCWRDLR